MSKLVASRKESYCWESCECRVSVSGNVYTTCAYGTCRGYKCLSCGRWLLPQEDRKCSLEEVTEDVKEG